MGETVVGRATARFPELVYEPKAMVEPNRTVSFPLWSRVAFVAGLVIFFVAISTLQIGPILSVGRTGIAAAFGGLALGATLVAVSLGVASKPFALR